MMDNRTRREVLAATGTATIGAIGLAGCTSNSRSGNSGNGSLTSNNGSGTSSGSEKLDHLTIANATHFGNMQHYVMQEHGAYDDITNDLTIKNFTSGPKIVKAFVSGSVDIAYFGISPTFVIHDKANKGTIPVASTRNGLRVMSIDSFADLYKQKKGNAFSAFETKHGRKLRVASAPEGSVPDVILRYWIEKDLGLGDTDSVIQKKRVPPEKTAQAMEAGEVDATMIHEPFATVLNNTSGFTQAEWSGNILDGHPVKVVFVNDKVFSNKPAVTNLVKSHVEATKFIQDNPKKAAMAAVEHMGTDIEKSLAIKAMKSPAMNFVSDPRAVKSQSLAMAKYVDSVGKTSSVIEPDEVFDTSIYDSVATQTTSTQ
ncbi:ABC transporter substrate-binding protein [Haladaptatus sp. AB618]|uniref:ABC transporter substrate-binding protein n=1 Tax=Haladaptatus sp. AB618 TaxID=2934173 RepID=UPI0034E94C50